jgi:hypothetical protein
LSYKSRDIELRGLVLLWYKSSLYKMFFDKPLYMPIAGDDEHTTQSPRTKRERINFVLATSIVLNLVLFALFGMHWVPFWQSSEETPPTHEYINHELNSDLKKMSAYCEGVFSPFPGFQMLIR